MRSQQHGSALQPDLFSQDLRKALEDAQWTFDSARICEQCVPTPFRFGNTSGCDSR